MIENTNSGCLQRDSAEHEGYAKRQGHSTGYGKKETVHSRNSWKRSCAKII